MFARDARHERQVRGIPDDPATWFANDLRDLFDACDVIEVWQRPGAAPKPLPARLCSAGLVLVCRFKQAVERSREYAECVFVSGLNPAKVGESIRGTREQARLAGRNPEDILFFLYAKVITADTEAAVQRKHDEYLSSVSYAGALALLSGWAGIDFSQYELDKPLEYVETNAVRTLMQSFIQPNAQRRWTLRDLMKLVGLSGGGPLLMGTPEQLADTLAEWVRAGVDGFNLAYMVTPGSFVDFIDGVVPILQKRGLMQTEYQDGTLREKLTGAGRARLRAPHPAAHYRH